MHAVCELLRLLPKSELNVGGPPSCSAVETIVGNGIWSYCGGRVDEKERDGRVPEYSFECGREVAAALGENRGCSPVDVEKFGQAHRADHRLLADTQGAAEALWLVELCRTSAIRHKIGGRRPAGG